MRVTAWKYVCGHCGSAYVVPGCDLSFAYAAFLGVPRGGAVVVLDAHGDPTFDDVRQRVHEDERTSALTAEQRDALLLSVLSAVYDDDENGDPYVFAGSPGCPACDSTTVASFTETDEPMNIPAPPATHGAWDSLGLTDRDALVGSTLDRLLDGA